MFWRLWWHPQYISIITTYFSSIKQLYWLSFCKTERLWKNRQELPQTSEWVHGRKNASPRWGHVMHYITADQGASRISTFPHCAFSGTVWCVIWPSSGIQDLLYHHYYSVTVWQNDFKRSIRAVDYNFYQSQLVQKRGWVEKLSMKDNGLKQKGKARLEQGTKMEIINWLLFVWFTTIDNLFKSHKLRHSLSLVSDTGVGASYQAGYNKRRG